MTIHEYVFVTISIIYGLAITRLLSNILAIVRAGVWSRIRVSDLIWCASVVLLLLWFIWIGFSLRDFAGFSYWLFFYMTLTAAALFGAIEFSLPGLEQLVDEPPQGESIAENRGSPALVCSYLFLSALGNIVFINASIPVTLMLTLPGIVITLAMVLAPGRFSILSPLFLLYVLVTNTPAQQLVFNIL